MAGLRALRRPAPPGAEHRLLGIQRDPAAALRRARRRAQHRDLPRGTHPLRGRAVPADGRRGAAGRGHPADPQQGRHQLHGLARGPGRTRQAARRAALDHRRRALRPGARQRRRRHLDAPGGLRPQGHDRARAGPAAGRAGHAGAGRAGGAGLRGGALHRRRRRLRLRGARDPDGLHLLLHAVPGLRLCAAHRGAARRRAAPAQGKPGAGRLLRRGLRRHPRVGGGRGRDADPALGAAPRLGCSRIRRRPAWCTATAPTR